MRADAVCRRVADALSETAGGELPPGAERDHLEQCLRCQATAVRFRRLDRELVALGADRLQPPDDLLAETLELLRSGSTSASKGWRPRAAEVAALAAAATGAAAGAVVLGRRLLHSASSA
ncbi:MAG: hypothetical protein AAGA99_22525 [Actinomycetota bacterium]